jgi:CheY-like chemotaxis protein
MEPFFSTKKQGAGMGVGLSLSRAIAHDHGGELVLCDGTGHTHFRLTLPVGREIASPASEDRGREAPLPLTGVNVLIVDDETSLCDIFGKLLLAAGCGSVKTAENGEVALAILKARSIDLLITDLHMPVMDGLTLLRWLHEIGRSVSSVLFISSCADIDPEEMHALGVEALISKPCRPQQLIEAVVKAFAGRNCRESVDSTLRAFSEAETSV